MAFLCGNIEEEGTVWINCQEFILGGHENSACFLKKAIYRLKQLVSAWNMKIHRLLIKARS
jgi:hypothetical protein